MNASFVVTVNLLSTDPQSIADAAERIADAIDDSGLELISVNPWDRGNADPGFLNLQAIQGESIIRSPAGFAPQPISPASAGPENTTAI